MLWYVFIITVTFALLASIYANHHHVFSSRRRERSNSGKMNVEEIDREKLLSLRIRYIIVYGLATYADWSQGAYFYDAYSKYGFSRNEIQLFFVIGFGSSAIFGTLVASLADRFGRKRLVQIYFLIYSLNCLCIHNRALWSILLGRILGGIATSLLFSSFDSWFVCSHSSSGLQSELGPSFSIAGLVNSATAICAGLASEFLVNNIPKHMGKKVQTFSMSYGSSLSPFEMSFVVLVIGLILVTFIWDRSLSTRSNDNNNNKTKKKENFLSDLFEGAIIVYHDMNIFLLGIMVASFEGAMYIWVICWTPALESDNDDDTKKLPLGLLFSTFMAASMLGTQCFAILIKHVRVETILCVTFLFSFLSLIAPVLVSSRNIRFVCFFVFEICVGLWWPASSSFKGEIIQEPTRASVYSVFRVPMNCIVIVILVSSLSLKLEFLICSLLLVLGFFSSLMLSHRRRSKKSCCDDEPSSLMQSSLLEGELLLSAT